MRSYVQDVDVDDVVLTTINQNHCDETIVYK